MMRYDFFPDREVDMVNWGNTFANVLQQTVGHFGLSPDRVARFIELQQEFAQAYAVASSPSTRTSVAVTRKNVARKAMEHEARQMAKWLGGEQNMSDTDRSLLGLTVAKTRTRNVTPPTSAPEVYVIDVVGNRVTIALVDAERSTRRARPDNATGAVLLSAVGHHAPATRQGWTFLKSTTSTRLTIAMDASQPIGTRVWFCSAWSSRRSQLSPWSTPASAVLLGDVNLSSRSREKLIVPAAPQSDAPAHEQTSRAA